MNNKEKIYKDYINISINLSKKQLHTIMQCSELKINPELLFSIVIIEKMNRGNLSNYIFEKTLSILFPSILIRSDASIGLCQIRNSAAKKVLDLPDKKIIRKLMSPTDNIIIMAKLIKLYTDERLNREDSIKKILNLHITAKESVEPNIYLNMYYELVSWSTNNKLFLNMYKTKYY